LEGFTQSNTYSSILNCACLAEQALRLGPDPLREDAHVEELWVKMQKCKKAVGLVLMDQTMMAGEGVGWTWGWMGGGWWWWGVVVWRGLSL
jgi:formamidopyrimidine-DNA glycosylase